MPNVLQLLARRPAVLCHDELAEEQPLMFPSDLSATELALCTPGIAKIEEQLRDGQMHDALEKLRIHLHEKTRLLNFKNRNVRNQIANTRARTRIDANQIRVMTYARKYRRARDAKLKLTGTGEWEKKYRVLNDSDIRTLRGDAYDAVSLPADGTLSTLLGSEGRRRTSWIWFSGDTADGDDGDGGRQEGESPLCHL